MVVGKGSGVAVRQNACAITRQGGELVHAAENLDLMTKIKPAGLWFRQRRRWCACRGKLGKGCGEIEPEARGKVHPRREARIDLDQAMIAGGLILHDLDLEGPAPLQFAD
jgi:hypothetical protein